MQRSQFQQPVAKPIPAKKKREIPLPIAIPVTLFKSIRATCTYMSRDENENNNLNTNNDPVVINHNLGDRTISVVCYSPDLLLLWLRYLVHIDIWGRDVKCVRPCKSRSGNSVYESTEIVTARCLYLPTETEIRSKVPKDLGTAIELLKTVEAIRKLLIENKNRDTKLITPSDILAGEMPGFHRVSTPGNIVKIDRLIKMGYSKLSISDEIAAKWNSFYRSETNRIKYVANKMQTVKITDASIRCLTGSQKDMYNSVCLGEMVSKLGFDNIESDNNLNDGIVDKRMPGISVNPAILKLQEFEAASKAKKDPNKININKKYKDMIEDYYMRTGYRLDIRSEKNNKTYEMRMFNLQWADDMLRIDPTLQFEHNITNDRLRAIQGISNSDNGGTRVQYNSNSAQRESQQRVVQQPQVKNVKVVEPRGTDVYPFPNPPYLSTPMPTSHISSSAIQNIMNSRDKQNAQSTTKPLGLAGTNFTGFGDYIKSIPQTPVVPSQQSHTPIIPSQQSQTPVVSSQQPPQSHTHTSSNSDIQYADDIDDDDFNPNLDDDDDDDQVQHDYDAPNSDDVLVDNQ